VVRGIAIEFPENCFNLVKCAVYTLFMEDGVIDATNLGERTLFEGRLFDNLFNHPKHWNAYVYRVNVSMDTTLITKQTKTANGEPRNKTRPFVLPLR